MRINWNIVVFKVNLFSYLQIHFTQAFLDKVYNWRTENKLNITCVWVGPLTAFVLISHPEYIKSLLKSIIDT